MKRALVFGAGGFIGNHMVSRLRSEGYFVVGVDLKHPEFSKTDANEFIIGDLRSPGFVDDLMPISFRFNELYQFAADMGGAGYIFTGDHDADIMHNSATINLNVANAVKKIKEAVGAAPKIFYSSSACIYPQGIQEKTNNPGLKESDAYPADPDSEYGYEKIFSERLYQAYARNYGLDVRIARFHNIFGPYGTYRGGKEKAPAAICRKVAESALQVEVWGDGNQTRSFLYIDECIEGVRRLMNSDVTDVVNIGSDEMVSINQLAAMAIQISRKELEIVHVDGPQGVRGRNSNNDFIRQALGWCPTQKLYSGLEKTYRWINGMVNGGY